MAEKEKCEDQTLCLTRERERPKIRMLPILRDLGVLCGFHFF